MTLQSYVLYIYSTISDTHTSKSYGQGSGNNNWKSVSCNNFDLL